jgi:hypothetical protein
MAIAVDDDRLLLFVKRLLLRRGRRLAKAIWLVPTLEDLALLLKS